MSEKKQINFRYLTLEELVSLKPTFSAPAYANLVKGSLRGRDLELLRRRLLSTDVPKHDRELAHQEEFISLLFKDQQQITDDIEKENEFVKKLESEYAAAYEKYQQALAELNRAKSRLEAANKVSEQFSSSQKNIGIAIDIAQKRKEEIKRTVLVHKSASIGQLVQYSFGKMVVTKADASFLKELIVPDVVFDNPLAEGLLEKVPFNTRTLSVEEWLPIKKFVEMVMYYYLAEDEMPVVLYADQNIAAILKKEGL